jgi:hypothetical protein
VLGKGVRAAGLFEATNQRLIGAFQKEQLNRDTLAPQLLKGIGKLTQRLVGTAVDDGGDALTPPHPLHKGREERRREVVDAEVADVLQRLECERLPAPDMPDTISRCPCRCVRLRLAGSAAVLP